ncbi:MAG: protein kinase [Candidatus Schekmanbacteria bacterium]|nr:protein kinase [Candidatus Schekmanbacteria bacterium]
MSGCSAPQETECGTATLGGAGASAPAPQVVGPYCLEERLAEGGMGAVYRARHAATGTVVALKMVKLPTRSLLQAIRREIRALSMLDHPGIVRVVADGLHDGMPWFAMPFVQGTSMRQHLTALPPRSWATSSAVEAPEEAPADRMTAALSIGEDAPHAIAVVLPIGADLTAPLALICRLCGALAYLHGEGFVHRDLKPDNVLVTPEGAPILIDFGLASPGGYAGRERVAARIGALGTPHYMSPEQIRGRDIDARADLYALGVMLYELVAGQRPFAGSATEVIKAHLYRQPPPLSVYAPDLPAGLENLVMRLLAKEPSRRPGHVRAVATALARFAGAASTGWEQASATRPCLYRPRFAGRRRELRTLLDMVRATQRENGGLVLVHGESGAGKSRLALEVAERASGGGVLVLHGNCLAGRAAALGAFRGVIEHVADRCHERGPAETDRLLGRRRAVLAQYFPFLSSLDAHRTYPQPATLAPEAARLRLIQYLWGVLTALTAEHAALVVLDDLQWADELAMAFLGHVAARRLAAASRLLLVGLYRSEERTAELQALAAAPGVRLLALGKLGEAPMRALVGDMLAVDPAPAIFSRFLVECSEGNPFFAGEYLRAAVDRGLIWRDDREDWQVTDVARGGDGTLSYGAVPLPRSIRDLLAGRLVTLSERSRQVLEVAAVVGREIPSALLDAVAGSEGMDCLTATAELMRRNILEGRDRGNLVFVHDKLREEIYAGTGAARRRALHLAVALALETAVTGDGAVHARRGHHFELAGEVASARSCYLLAARAAAKRFAHQEAERLYRAHLALVAEPTSESIEARRELGFDVLRVQARWADAASELDGALAAAREIGDRRGEGRVCGYLATVHLELGEVEKAQTGYEQALALAREVGDRRDEALWVGNLATVRLERVPMIATQNGYEQALAIAREVGDKQAEGWWLGALAGLLGGEGRSAEAREAYAEALSLARELADRSSESWWRGNVAILDCRQGHVEEALAGFEQALAMSREIGDRRAEGWWLRNLAIAHHELGYLQDAHYGLGLALELAREAGDRHAEGLLLADLACECFALGRMEASEVAIEQALRVSRELGDTVTTGRALAAQARFALVAGGDALQARRLSALAVTTLRERRWLPSLTWAICLGGHIALANGESAASMLEEARCLTTTIGTGPGSPLDKDIGRLRRAQEAFGAAGGQQRLFRGYLVEDFTAEQRQWLRNHGHLAAP